MRPLTILCCALMCAMCIACTSHPRLPECRGPFAPINTVTEGNRRE